MIRGKGISVELSGRELISDVSLDVLPGEFVALVGANGAGKTTLLRALSGELKPSCGSVELVGRVLGEWPALERALRLAVLPQASSLSFGLTVREIVSLGTLPLAGRISKTAQSRLVHLAMVKAEVEDLADRNYLTLSGGEKLRTHLARAMAQILEPVHADPRTLLLDEPTSSLDLRHQIRVLEIVREFTSVGIGVLAILHDLNLTARFADRVFVLHEGKLLAQGPPSEVFTPALLGEAFGIESTLVNVAGLEAPQVCVMGVKSSVSQAASSPNSSSFGPKSGEIHAKESH